MSERVRTLAKSLATATEWLAQCPFSNGQPFYETANKEITELQENIIEAATEAWGADGELTKKIGLLITDGPKTDEEWEEWLEIANY
jgi:hypothetical protein